MLAWVRLKLRGDTAVTFLVLSMTATSCGAADGEPPGMEQRKPLTASFFHETALGEALLSYLLCVDFDCLESSRRVREQGPQAVPVLLEVLESGLPVGAAPDAPPGLIRRRAVKALGVVGDPRATAPLIELLEDPDPLVRSAAVEALGRIRNGVDGSSVLPLLRDPDPLVREMTAAALAELGDSDSLPYLRDAAASEELDHVRRAIEEAIGTIERR